MKKFSFAIPFALVFAASVFAQTDSSTQPNRCGGDAIARPTLKRRTPTTEAQPESANVQASNSQPCENSGAQSMKERPLSVEFEGLTAVPESDLHKYMREQRIAQTLDSISNGSAVAEAAIREFFVEDGYRHAQVSSRLDHRDNETVLTFVISEGPRFEISRIRFQGNRVFSEQVLAARTSECLARSKRESDPEDVFRPEVFEYCLHTLTDFERSEGYLQARFGEPRAQEIGQMVEIIVESNEGVVYRLGNLEIEGADHVAEEDIRAMLDLHRGDVINADKLLKALYEQLKAVYGEKGFIQYTAEIQPEFHHQLPAVEGLVDFKISIDEGRRFKVGKITFKGDNLPENELLPLLLLRKGDIYNQRLFEQSLKQIYETGLFNEIDKDKDVDFRSDEEQGLVNMVIRLTRRPPNGTP